MTEESELQAETSAKKQSPNAKASKKAESLSKPTAKTANKPDYSKSFLAMIGVTICLNCGAKRVCHRDGSVIQCCDNPRFE